MGHWRGGGQEGERERQRVDRREGEYSCWIEQVKQVKNVRWSKTIHEDKFPAAGTGTVEIRRVLRKEEGLMVKWRTLNKAGHVH